MYVSRRVLVSSWSARGSVSCSLLGVYLGMWHEEELWQLEWSPYSGIYNIIYMECNHFKGVARICDRGFPARIAHAHNLRICAQAECREFMVNECKGVEGYRDVARI